MHFSITAEVQGGLRVIPEIADYDLCWLEGRNGIGKSLAVRLLQLISGDQPYRLQRASWDSLRQLLGHTRIRITDLRGEEVVEVELVPGDWPDDPASAISVLGSARLNGNDLPISEVRRHLRVFRIGGDESVVSRFRSRVETDRNMFERQTAWLDARLDEQAAISDRLRQDLAGLSLDDWRSLADRATQANEAHRATSERLGTVRDAIELLRDRDSLERALEQLRTEGPGLGARLAEIASEIERVRSERDRLDQERLRLAPAAQRLEELLNRQRSLARARQTKVAAAQSVATAASEACRSLGVATDRAALDVLGNRTSEERAAILRDRSALELLPEVTAVIQELERPLAPLVGSSLDAEIVAVIGRRRVSVEALRSGLSARENELAGHEQFAILAEMERRIAELDERRGAVRRAKALLTRAERAAADLAQTEQRWNSLAAEIERAQPANLAALASEIAKLDESHIALVREQAELVYRQRALSEAGSEQSLNVRLDTVRSRLEDQHPGLIRAMAEEELSRLQLESAAQQESLAALIGEQHSFKDRLGQVTLLIASSESYAWLRNAIGERLPSPGTNIEAALATLGDLSEVAQRLEAAADSLRTEAASVRDALGLISDALSPGGSPASGSRHIPSLTKHYEEAFGQLLKDPVIQEALFPDGQFTSLDLLRSEIAWRDQSGIQRKPIEAFSSGERAFAFVLASILQHAGDETPNRLMVLDEFGAFIDAEGRERLKQFLEERVLAANIADQVVVMLPLREGLSGEQSREVEARGYFMERIGAAQ
jgi:predicted nuclease with TOPRIM domain